MSKIGSFAWASTRAHARMSKGRLVRSASDRWRRANGSKMRRYHRKSRLLTCADRRAIGIPPAKYLATLAGIAIEAEDGDDLDLRHPRVRWLAAAGFIVIGDERYWLLTERAYDALATADDCCDVT